MRDCLKEVAIDGVTIPAGVKVGFGDRWNDADMRSFGPGGFYVNPAESHHFVGFQRTSVLQITGEGPWVLNMLE